MEENMCEKIDKVYSASKYENEIYDYWLKNNFFYADVDSQKKPYTIVMPPPNITGRLHMGHALDCTLQDILIRFKRMCGYEALWVPGTDHAALSTEAKIVEQLKKEGLSKQSIGYDKFMERALKWKETYGGCIVSQIKKMGASCDWSRERFTMDDICSRAVRRFFVSLYKKGYIYKGARIVNWCTNCNTSISDIEVDFKESESDLVYLKYYLEDKSNFLTVATTRPETIFGDVALCVNPDDNRYKSYIGKNVIIPIVNRKIPVIADAYVDQTFGTGVLKVTPAHDFADFEIGERHNLESISVIDNKGIINEKCGDYCGLDRFKCRKKIIENLSSKDLVVKIEKIKNNVGVCSRCKSVIEPLISDQWFVKMREMAIPAINAVENGDIKFYPERFSKIYMHWMNNVKDWCISRQIWWGHRIPVYYCQDCNYMNAFEDHISSCEKCGSSKLAYEEDSLDTWFSSALWPFSVMGWPENTKDLNKFYPTDVLVTGYDIIFFWVARMIFSSLELTGKIPFKKVLIHGLVRDANGKKMSKSSGNGIDPLDIIEKYGTDALRLTLVTGLSLGNDTRFLESKLEGNRNFINKIWNASRFLHMNLGNNSIEDDTLTELSTIDKWMLSRVNRTSKEIRENLEKFEFGIALQKIYSLFWDEFCDSYLEFCKIDFKNNTSKVKNACIIFLKILNMLHPFIPFVTEKIWSIFKKTPLILSKYVNYNPDFDNSNAEDEINKLIALIHSIRTKRNEMNTPHSKKIKIYINTKFENIIKNHEDKIKDLASVREIVINNCNIDKNMVSSVLDFAEIKIELGELSDIDEIISHFKKEIDDLEIRIEKSKKMLDNKGFIEKAPVNVIDDVKKTLEQNVSRLNKMRDNLNCFNK